MQQQRKARQESLPGTLGALHNLKRTYKIKVLDRQIVLDD